MVNRSNYKLTREFLRFKEEIKQVSPGSIHRYKTDLNHFLIWLDETSMGACNTKFPSFSTYLMNYRINGQRQALAPATQKKIIQTTKQFLRWLKQAYPNQFKNLSSVWLESLQPATKAYGPRNHEFVSLEEAIDLATKPLPVDKLVYRRDQAAVAMLFLSGMRASALTSLPIKAVDIHRQEIKQWPSLGVRTKYRKHATTYLLDIPELMDVVRRWDDFIRNHLSSEAMWYSVIISEWSDEKLSARPPGNNRHVNLAKRIRKLAHLLDVNYKSPHKFRHGHAVYALLQAQTMADYKAISQNLMHGSVNVTDSIYAWLNDGEVRNRIAGLSHQAETSIELGDELEDYLQRLSKDELKLAIVQVANMLAG